MVHSKTTLVLLAAGNASRFGGVQPKQFIPLQDKPLFWYSLETFLKVFGDLNVVLVLPEAHLEEAHRTEWHFELGERMQVVTGGVTRVESVRNALSKVEDDTMVIIHDAARPFTTPSLVEALFESALKYGSAVPFIEMHDTVYNVVDEVYPSRAELVRIQTPQFYEAANLKYAFSSTTSGGSTDESSIMAAAGHHVNLVPGEETNFKITTKEDWEKAQRYLTQRSLA